MELALKLSEVGRQLEHDKEFRASIEPAKVANRVSKLYIESNTCVGAKTKSVPAQKLSLRTKVSILIFNINEKSNTITKLSNNKSAQCAINAHSVLLKNERQPKKHRNS